MFASLLDNVYGMQCFNINTKTVNVELTKNQQYQVWRHLTPLFRLIDRPDQTKADVVVRTVEKPLGRTLYYLAVRFVVDEVHYYGVYQSVHFNRGLRYACADLRKQISRSYNPHTQMIEHMRREAHEDLFAKMFV